MSRIQTKTKNSCSFIKEKALDLDQFGSGFNFKLPEGKDTINTMVGFFTSVMVIIIIILYSGM